MEEGEGGMKALKVTTDGVIETIEVSVPLHKTVGKIVGGFEIVRPRRLKRPLCMIVDDVGLMKGLPFNPVGSYYYQTDMHGSPIVGDIVIMKEQMSYDGIDLIGLEDEEITELAIKATHIFKELKLMG